VAFRKLAAVAWGLACSLALPGAAAAQGEACVDVCGVSCVKPWAIADRWDNVTGIPGYMGEGEGRLRRPDWRNNALYDHEAFTDANGNRLYDIGESYLDGNGNGACDVEFYDPQSTGYVGAAVPGHLLSPAGDSGLELVLHYDSGSGLPVPDQYLSVAFPPVNKGAPSQDESAYRANIGNCNETVIEPGDWLRLYTAGLVGPTNQGMSDLIAQDPDATWDSSTGSVQNSGFTLSPRVVFLPVYDPRFSLSAGSVPELPVVKIVAFFMERMTGPAEVRGKLLRTTTPAHVVAASCPAGSVPGFLVECAVPASRASWGRVKGTYR
jgi:hypothetical protein